MCLTDVTKSSPTQKRKAKSACHAGVDGSERIADVAKRLVAANNLAAEQGGPISVVQGRLEQLSNLPVDKVSCCTTYYMSCCIASSSC